MNIRSAFAGALLLTSALLPAACGTSPNLSQTIADAQILVSGVEASYAALKVFSPGISSTAADARIVVLEHDLDAALATLKAAQTAADQASGIRAVEADVNGIANLAAVLVADIPGVPPGVVLGFQAAEILLPIIEATANQLVPQTVGSPGVPAMFVSHLTPAEARAVLASKH